MLARASRRARSTTSRRRRSCRCRGEQPVATAEFAAVGVTSLLEAVRAVDTRIRVYQASSSEIFGEPAEVPQTEATPLAPGDAVRRREGVRPLHHRLVPAPLRAARELRDPLQPRVAAPARRLPAEQGRARRGGDLARARERARCSATSTRSATGATPATTSRRCGGCSSRTSRRDYVIATGELHTVARARRDRVRARRARLARARARRRRRCKRGQAELHHLVGDASRARERLGWRAARRLRRARPAAGRRGRSRGSVRSRVRNTASLHSGEMSDQQELSVDEVYAQLRDAVDRGARDLGTTRGLAERFWPVSADKPLERRPGLKGWARVPGEAGAAQADALVRRARVRRAADRQRRAAPARRRPLAPRRRAREPRR